MNIALTGGTGLIGRAVLAALVQAGHDVTALVRSEASAATVSEAGATAAIGDLGDVAWVGEVFAAADGAAHTASPGDATSPDFDRAVVEAALAAYRGTDKPYVHTGGIWVHGAGTDITETTPFTPPELTAWRTAVENEAFGGGFRTVVIEPGIVYGGGQGLPALLSTPDEEGRYHSIGDGSQHWTTVAATQLAELYVLALENDAASGYYLGINDDHPTVRELVEAAAGDAEIVWETPEQSRERLFAPLVDALLLDQIASNARARDLGWNPTGPSLVDELRAARG